MKVLVQILIFGICLIAVKAAAEGDGRNCDENEYIILSPEEETELFQKLKRKFMMQSGITLSSQEDSDYEISISRNGRGDTSRTIQITPSTWGENDTSEESIITDTNPGAPYENDSLEHPNPLEVIPLPRQNQDFNANTYKSKSRQSGQKKQKGRSGSNSFSVTIDNTENNSNELPPDNNRFYSSQQSRQRQRGRGRLGYSIRTQSTEDSSGEFQPEELVQENNRPYSPQKSRQRQRERGRSDQYAWNEDTQDNLGELPPDAWLSSSNRPYAPQRPRNKPQTKIIQESSRSRWSQRQPSRLGSSRWRQEQEQWRQQNQNNYYPPPTCECNCDA